MQPNAPEAKQNPIKRFFSKTGKTLGVEVVPSIQTPNKDTVKYDASTAAAPVPEVFQTASANEPKSTLDPTVAPVSSIDMTQAGGSSSEPVSAANPDPNGLAPRGENAPPIVTPEPADAAPSTSSLGEAKPGEVNTKVLDAEATMKTDSEDAIEKMTQPVPTPIFEATPTQSTPPETPEPAEAPPANVVPDIVPAVQPEQEEQAQPAVVAPEPTVVSTVQQDAETPSSQDSAVPPGSENEQTKEKKPVNLIKTKLFKENRDKYTLIDENGEKHLNKDLLNQDYENYVSAHFNQELADEGIDLAEAA